MNPSRTATPISPLDAHLPLDRRLALAQRQALPQHSWGAVLFADVSGFTPLMERLANALGPQQGAERLTLLLNALFTPLIAEIHRYGGTIVAFGGDALTCWFPALSPSPLCEAEQGKGEASSRAAACALAMLPQVKRFSAETPSAPATLAMHIGVATGPVHRFVVGRPPYGQLDVLAGATLDRMAEAQHRADVGRVVVDAATAAALPTSTLRPLDEGFFLVDAVDAMALPPEPDRGSPLPARRVRPWLAEPLYRRLRAGHGALAAELRLVTPMFVNLGGLDYDADPDAGNKLHLYVVQAQEHLAPYEGHLAALTCGDKGTVLYVVFGAPIAHEDDPARAVGLALTLQEAARELPFLTVQRIGIGVGRAYAGILGSAARCTYSVLGDEVNTSARLMQAAQPGQILASGPVKRAAAGRFTFRSLGRIALKGKEEAVPIFEPLAVRESRPAAAAEGVLIGRDVEKQTIAEVLAHVAAGQGGALLVEGEAGVGKSALVHHLLQQVRGHGWPAYIGSCLSYGQHIPYLPWRLILEEVYRLDPAWGPAERAVRLEEAVAGLPDPAGQPGYWRARFPLLAAAVGLEVPDTPLTHSLEGELRRDNTFQLLEALVRAAATTGPAVIILEDASWADELSRQLATHVARGLANLPLLLVLVQRPPDREAAATVSWRNLPNLVSVVLAPLEHATALELARRRLDAAAIPSELEALLLEKAQGNPFFVEELVRALLEGGCLQRVDHTVQLCGGWQSLQLPDTIEGVVQARLDRLPEEDHLTLKVSAVIGRTFERPLLREVHPSRLPEGALARQLDQLEEAATVILEEPAPQWRYAFQHPILHEVTYSTLLFAQRRQLHGEIGEVLERWYAKDLPRVLDLLAYHYARSEEREKAVHYLQRAADKARREYANEVALGYYSQALERLGPQEAALRYDLLAGRERIHDLLGEREAQERDLWEMGRLAETLGDAGRQVEVLNRRARRAADMGALEDGQQLARKALEIAHKAACSPGEASAYSVLAILQANAGEYDDAWGSFQQALHMHRALGQQEGEFTCLGNLGLLSLYRGNLEESQTFYHQALQMASHLSDRRREGRLLLNLGLSHRPRGDYDQARAYSEQARAIFQEIGDQPSLEISLDSLGAVAIAQGDLDAALNYQQQALQLARQLEDIEGEATSLCSMGLVSIYQGLYAQARKQLHDALLKFRQIGHRRGEADVLHIRGVLEALCGRPQEAHEPLRQALALREEIGESGNALVTRAWLGLVHHWVGENAAAVNCIHAVLAQLENEGYGSDAPQQEVWWAAYQVWRGAGEAERAHEALRRAYQLVQEQAGRIGDPARRQSFLERIPVNREIVTAWGLEVG
jgi:class 3 adenylate cyclase/tetratricopeptide (TPR) repeat protein